MSFSPALNANTWEVSKLKFMKPRVNDSGKGKNVMIISTQLNTSLKITTPLMKTYGISDFTDPKTGASDGRYSISIQFPAENESTPEIAAFLEKMRAFENTILNEAASQSELWWGKAKSRETCEDSFTTTLKYPKIPESQTPDRSRPPTMRGKVYMNAKSGKWDLDIYDQNKELIFPTDGTSGDHPASIVVKGSRVACILQCSGVWLVGAGWGVTWKCVQVVVKPPENYQMVGTGKCFIEGDFSDGPQQVSAATVSGPSSRGSAFTQAFAATKDEINGTIVDDSDEEGDAPQPLPAVPATKAVVVVAAPAAEIVVAEPDVVSTPELEPEAESEAEIEVVVPTPVVPATVPKTVTKKKSVVVKAKTVV